ncbi:Hypothetical protein C882_3753 [Caenispirillum salinarum AK4]|uniref:Protein SlyX homolog n=1 Tax=Caenispirillum salinarum AK4 TaxID=1238182 RepID=K9GZF5_9PROT|nr:SlyX family protein [Caenispirillum salinarum]EKV31380.1 Hypothetical protein C882_3753 [Caenispirillum salinarum AK4]
MPADTPEDRIVDLEIRLAHQERMAEELSDVLVEQQRTIDRLTLQLRQVAERMGDLESGWARSPQDDKPPPHY